MIPDKRLETLKHFEELLKDSKRLDWLIKFLDQSGVFDEEDMKKLGFNDKNFRNLIDLVIDVPIDELLADLEQEEE